MAPSKSSLVQAGIEGFPMLDEYVRLMAGSKQPPSQQQQQFVRKFRHHPPKPHVVQVFVPVAETKEAVRIDCNEAAKIYGGTVITDYPNTKKHPTRYVP